MNEATRMAVERHCENEGIPLLPDPLTRIDVSTQNLYIYKAEFGIRTSDIPEKVVPLKDETRVKLTTRSGEVLPASPQGLNLFSYEGSPREADTLIYQDRTGARVARFLDEGCVFESKAREPLHSPG